MSKLNLILILIILLLLVGCVEQPKEKTSWNIILENGDIITVKAYQCILLQRHRLGSELVYMAYCSTKSRKYDLEIRAVGIFPGEPE